MGLLERVQAAEQKLESSQRQADQLQGRISGLEDEMEKLAGTKDIDEALRAVADWEKEAEKIHQKLEKLLDEIEEKING